MGAMKALSLLAFAASASFSNGAKPMRLDLEVPVEPSKPLHQRKMEYYEMHSAEFKFYPSLRNAPQQCSAQGFVSFGGEDYSCKDVDFLSFVGLEELLINRSGSFEDEAFGTADIWGWLSPDGREITLLCMKNGVRFLDTTVPEDPKNLGFLASNRREATWCDIKVYKDTAYIVKDRGSSDPQAGLGMQVFNLTRLLTIPENSEPVAFTHDFNYAEHGSAHNVISNVETGFMYTCGVRGGIDCNTGLHIINVSDPLNPTFVACIADDSYVHDAQCVVYRGKHRKYYGKEICVGFDVTVMTIWDVSDKANIKQISRTPYNFSHYSHQGWFSPDFSHVLLDDELDEADGGLTKTRTHIFDVSDLEKPVRVGVYDHPANAIDHNLYFWGDILKRGLSGSAPQANHPSILYAYHANYASGLRVVDTSGINERPPKFVEVGHFDIAPNIEARAFFGAWSTYMHPSGAVAVSSIERGLFMVYPRMAFGATNSPTPFPVAEPTVPVIPVTNAPVAAPTGNAAPFLQGTELVVVALIVAVVLFLSTFSVGVVIHLLRKQAAVKKTEGSEVEAKETANGVANPAFRIEA